MFNIYIMLNIVLEESKVRKQLQLVTYLGTTFTQELLSSLNFVIIPAFL